jgi:hypothetical protein
MKTLTAHIPDLLYEQVEKAAMKDNLSIDKIVTKALSAQIEAWTAKEYIRMRAERGSWDKFERVLEKVPDVEPENYDKL